MSITRISAKSLFVSEPNPRWFGNPSNPTPRPAHWTNSNWLKSRFHFAFAENMNGPRPWGVLRVLNDDLVQPDRGFGQHPHSNMEIITYVLDGFLTHRDTIGTCETLGRGSIQFMTAGTGIEHSEHNIDTQTPLRFIQTWIEPRKRDLMPNYGSLVGDDSVAEMRHNQWAHLCSDVLDEKRSTPVKVNQDVNLFVTELDPGASVHYELGPKRQAYMVAVEGTVDVALEGSDTEECPTETLEFQDAAKITGHANLRVTAGSEGAHVIMFEMKKAGH